MTTTVFPLSALRYNSCRSLSWCIACVSSGVKLAWALLWFLKASMAFTLISVFAPLDNGCIARSIPMAISTFGISFGVTEKFSPFDNRDNSLSDSSSWVKLTTAFSLVGPFGLPICFFSKLASLLMCFWPYLDLAIEALLCASPFSTNQSSFAFASNSNCHLYNLPSILPISFKLSWIRHLTIKASAFPRIFEILEQSVLAVILMLLGVTFISLQFCRNLVWDFKTSRFSNASQYFVFWFR